MEFIARKQLKNRDINRAAAPNIDFLKKEVCKMKNEILNKICRKIQMAKNDNNLDKYSKLCDTAVEEYRMCDPFFWAYLESYMQGLETLTFWSFWYLAGDVPKVLENCKRFGVKEFTISQRRTDLLDIAKKFTDLGCEIAGIEEVKVDGVVVPALKLKVG
jgi:hypothetical protein